MSLYYVLLLAFTLCGSTAAVAAESAAAPAKPTVKALRQIPARDFARFATYDKLAVSPSGDYLAVSARAGQKNVLLVLTLPEKKRKSFLVMSGEDAVAEIHWASNERLVVALGSQSGAAEPVLRTGELLAVNADGSDLKYLFGYQGGSISMRPGVKVLAESGFARFESAIASDPGNALVTITNTTQDNAGGTYYVDDFTPIYRLNLYNGKKSKVVSAPMRKPNAYFSDDRGRVWMVRGVGDDSYDQQVWWRPGAAGAWRRLPFDGRTVSLRSIDRAGTTAYLHDQSNSQRQCILKWSLLATADQPLPELQELVCNAKGPIKRIYFGINGQPYAYSVADDQSLVVIDAQSREAAVLASLQAQFTGQIVYLIDGSRDLSKLLYGTYSDRNSGEYFLYDGQRKSADFLDAHQDWIDPEEMAPVKRISYKARDGLQIDGLLTLPLGRDTRPLPLVMLPHGGPIGVEDVWAWDADAQFLANRGYAVLQVNYRGSGGRGEAFEKLGYGEWGGKMIDDLTDGARWAISTGVADAKRLCIFGASYGGYAALMSAVREPDLYRCAVGYAGVYDLNLLLGDSDVSKSAAGRLFWKDSIADTAEERARLSPIRYLDQLKAAVMIVHGESDSRTPFSQAKALRKALRDRKLEPEWLTKYEEGHGFANEDNRTELYERLAAFLEKNIGR